GSCLQHTRHCDVGVLADQTACIINHHHRAIVEIGHALIVFLTFLQDENPHCLAWEHDWLERIRQLVNIKDADSAQLGNFIQVEIIRDDHCVELFAELDQLQVYLTHGGKVSLDDLDVERAVVLKTIEHVQAAPAALALGRIRRVSYLLQLAQDELRNDQRPRQESCLGDVRDTPVDDYRRVE